MFEYKIEIQKMIVELVKDFSSTQLNWIKDENLTNRLRFNWLNMKITYDNDWKLDLNQNLNNAI